MNKIFENLANGLSPVILLLVRVILAYLFIQHATAKFFEWPVSMTGGNGAVPLFSLMGIGGIIEIVGAILIFLGLFTRAAAFILAGQMAVGYLMVHASADTFLLPILNHGELAIVYSMAFLLLLVTGAGKFSLDAKSE